ncbi:hypothetical protein ON010_g11927 [Phytophthora cinnamomi]|nr:hypothetical protein ON010_g11927 [Phytophthora cinnamomi]
MPGKLKKPALQRAKELCDDDTPLEEGDHWFAVAAPWWDEFQSFKRAEDGSSMRNDSIIDKQLSSKARKVAVLKPKLKEGADFVFVPESSWEVFARELGFDWEIRRESSTNEANRSCRSKLILSLSSDETEAEELVDDADQNVIVLASRAHTLGQLLSEVWLAAPEDFRQKFPQFLGCIDTTSSLSKTSAPDNSAIRACYHTTRSSDDEVIWVPVEKMMKRTRAPPTSLRLKPRAKKRQARGNDEESAGELQSEDGDGEQSEAEFDEHADQLKGDRSGLATLMNTKLGDLRLDNRSETTNGTARIHELLVERKLQGVNAGEIGWPSQGLEMQWRMNVAKRRNKVHVHYRSWESKWDEWISRTSMRIAPLHSKIPRWRSTLRAHSLVQVGIQVPNLRHPKWRNATVIEVVPSTDGRAMQAQADEDGSGLRVHVQVDDDDIWLPANDDLLCRPNTHNESKPLSKLERRLLAHEDTLPSDSSEVAEEATAEPEDDEDKEQNGNEEQEEHDVVEVDGDEDEDDDEAMSLAGHEGSSSPPLRPPRVTKAAVAATVVSRPRMGLRDGVGTARSLDASFSQAQYQGLSSAGRTPARGRSRSNKAQVSSNDTSPEPISPTPQVSASQLQTLWAQVGNDLQALHKSWSQLGEGLMVFLDARAQTERSQN